ncbi:MAG TPA: biotin/lipoyl-containing protein, partial [Baekduia sp.]|nr:biotin/lipoyl-containing protein [Baekduia sp.]
MAVEAAVIEVTLPAMGESVTEGTILEWHKQEGDTIEADEIIVEVSTDKVDAEVPSPASGTIVKIHFAEGDTVQVGSVLAEIAPGDGASANGSSAPPASEAPAAESDAPGEIIDIVTPAGGESVTEGTILEWAVKVGDAVGDGDTVVEISTDKVDMELPAPAAGTITELLAEEGETVTVGQVIARMQTGA